MFGLSPTDWSLIETLCIHPLKSRGAAVWIFGSRARGEHRPYSDVDLVFETPAPLPVGLLGKIRENLEESRLPVKVDLVSWPELAESYRERAERERIVI